MTKPLLNSLQTQIDSIRTDIIKILFPIATKHTQNFVINAEQQHHSKRHQGNQEITPATSVRPTYSAITQRKPAQSTVIISEAINKDQPTSTTSQIINKVSQHISDKNIPATILKTAISSSKQIVMKFKSTDNVEAVASELRTELGLDARGRTPLLPRMTMSHIPAHIGLNENLRDNIVKNNTFLQDSINTGTFEVLYTYKAKDIGSAVLKTSPNVRNAILNNQGTIIIGNRACPVRDRVQPLRCTKCCGYGHTRKTCKAVTPTCNFCAGSHETSTCIHKTDTSKHCCHNCSKKGQQPNSHPAFDKNCPALKIQCLKLINNTDYGTQTRPQI